MIHDLMYVSRAGEVEILPPSHSISGVSVSMALEPIPAVMSESALAEHCKREINNYRRGKTSDERYCLELLRRATLQRDQSAWECLQQIFDEIVRSWMRYHPRREAAYRLDSEENYVARAFERFWQATTQNQKLEFGTIAAALRYLHASLNGAVLDTLRDYSRHREVALPAPGFPGEPLLEEDADSGEIWEILKKVLHDPREQRVAYLLFHCGLKPREIIRFCPQEFSDVQAIYCLRRSIIEQLRRSAHQIRQQLELSC
jgi:hypothetical protein